MSQLTLRFSVVEKNERGQLIHKCEGEIDDRHATNAIASYEEKQQKRCKIDLAQSHMCPGNAY